MAWEAVSALSFSYPPRWAGKSSLLLGVVGGRAHDLHTHQMVWWWTSYSRALMPAGSLDQRARGLPRGKLVSPSMNVSGRQNDGKHVQPPSQPLGIPGAAV